MLFAMILEDIDHRGNVLVENNYCFELWSARSRYLNKMIKLHYRLLIETLCFFVETLFSIFLSIL